MSFPTAMSGWPEHMYVDENGERVIRCLACEYKFTTNELVETQVNHYGHDSFPGISKIQKIQHRILRQMHRLKVCLVCSTTFRNQPDPRALFNHVIQNHRDEEDMSTIQGFLLHVRKYPDKIPAASPSELGYRTKTFQLAFDHLKLQLTTGELRPLFRTVMGYPSHLGIPDEKLREVLTEPGVVENFPKPPTSFLLGLRYETHGSILPSEQWHARLHEIQKRYREGKI